MFIYVIAWHFALSGASDNEQRRSASNKAIPKLAGDCFVGKERLLATLAPAASAGVTSIE